jgi:hypothetical protein
MLKFFLLERLVINREDEGSLPSVLEGVIIAENHQDAANRATGDRVELSYLFEDARLCCQFSFSGDEYVLTSLEEITSLRTRPRA